MNNPTLVRNTRRILEDRGIRVGTHPENLAALFMHRVNLDVAPQYRVGRYVIDFALPRVKVGIEIDGPHHMRPDVAVKDAFRDAWLRGQGWIILRVTGGEVSDELGRACRVARQILDAEC